MGLEDARELPALIDQLLLVVNAVPAMQSFIRSVCDIVMSGRHSGRPSTFASTAEVVSPTAMDLVLPTLRAWEAELTQVSSLTEIHSRLLAELSRRTHPFHHQLTGATPIELLFTELGDLVTSENRLFTLMYGPVQESKAKHDGGVVPDYSSLSSVASAAKMLAHFQHLFDVPHVNGVYPKMNELYVFASEQRAAMGQLRSLLRLGVGAPTAGVVNAVRERLGGVEDGGVKMLMAGDREDAQSRRRVEAVERGLQADLEHLYPIEEKSNPPSADRSGTGGRLTDGERHELLLVELSELMGASGHAEIPTLVERLLRQVEELRRKEAEWEKASDKAKEKSLVLKSLRRALHVEADSELLAAVQAVKASTTTPPIRIHGTVRPSLSSPSASSDLTVELLSQVKQMVDVTRSSEVLPTLKRLLGRLGMYEDVMPSVDRLVTSLYQLLDVREIAHILPAVRKLKGGHHEEGEDEDRDEGEDDVEVTIDRGGQGRTASVRISSPTKRHRTVPVEERYEHLEEEEGDDTEREDDEEEEEAESRRRRNEATTKNSRQRTGG